MLAIRTRISPCSSNSSSRCRNYEPVATVVVPLVGEAHGDPVLAKGPDFLDQAIVELTVPLVRQKCLMASRP